MSIRNISRHTEKNTSIYVNVCVNKHHETLYGSHSSSNPTQIIISLVIYALKNLLKSSHNIYLNYITKTHISHLHVYTKRTKPLDAQTLVDLPDKPTANTWFFHHAIRETHDNIINRAVESTISWNMLNGRNKIDWEITSEHRIQQKWTRDYYKWI